MRVVVEGAAAVQEKTDRKTGRVYRYPVAAGKVPEDWWTDVETLNHSDRERTGWPSQKPERLIERILRGGHGARAIASPTGSRARAPPRRSRSGSDGGSSSSIASARPSRCALARLAHQGRALAAAGTPPPPIVVSRACDWSSPG